jgi:hypothetical protein
VQYTLLTPAPGRPIVYLACGSHAAYPLPCDPTCHQTNMRCHLDPCVLPVSGSTDGPSDGAAPWGRNSDAACRTPTPCLIAFPLPSLAAPTSALTAGLGHRGSPPFTVWPGKWGSKGSPASPGLQPLFTNPRIVKSGRNVFERN